MQDDATKKTDPSDTTDREAGKIEDLPQKVSDRDAQSVKGGSPQTR